MSAAAKPAATNAATPSPTPGLPGRLYWALADSLAVAKRNLLRVPRDPEQLAFATVQPVIFVLLFRYVFGGAIHVGGGASYTSFLMAGIFAQTVATGSVGTAAGLTEDLSLGLVDRFRSLPMSRAAVLAGRTLFDLLRNAFVVGVMLAVGLWVGFEPRAGVLGWLGALGLLLLFGFALSWVFAAVGLLVSSAEAAQSVGFSVVFPLTFASSAFVPTSTMPGWLRAFAERQPVTQVVDAVRALFLDQPVGSHGWQAVAWCLGALVVFVPLSVSLYRRRAAR